MQRDNLIISTLASLSAFSSSLFSFPSRSPISYSTIFWSEVEWKITPLLLLLRCIAAWFYRCPSDADAHVCRKVKVFFSRYWQSMTDWLSIFNRLWCCRSQKNTITTAKNDRPKRTTAIQLFLLFFVDNCSACLVCVMQSTGTHICRHCAAVPRFFDVRSSFFRYYETFLLE